MAVAAAPVENCQTSLSGFQSQAKRWILQKYVPGAKGGAVTPCGQSVIDSQ